MRGGTPLDKPNGLCYTNNRYDSSIMGVWIFLSPRRKSYPRSLLLTSSFGLQIEKSGLATALWCFKALCYLGLYYFPKYLSSRPWKALPCLASSRLLYVFNLFAIQCSVHLGGYTKRPELSEGVLHVVGVYVGISHAANAKLL